MNKKLVQTLIRMSRKADNRNVIKEIEKYSDKTMSLPKFVELNLELGINLKALINIKYLTKVEDINSILNYLLDYFNRKTKSRVNIDTVDDLVRVMNNLKIDIYDFYYRIFSTVRYFKYDEVLKTCSCISKYLLRLRKSKHMTIKDICNEADITHNTVHKIEEDCSRVTLDKVIQYLVAMNIDINNPYVTPKQLKFEFIRYNIYTELVKASALSNVDYKVVSALMHVPLSRFKRMFLVRSRMYMEDFIAWDKAVNDMKTSKLLDYLVLR